MTSFLKSTVAAQEQSAVVFLTQAHEQLVGDGGSYHCKFGFKDLRRKPTKYPPSSPAKGPFVVGQASRLPKNYRPPTRHLGQFKGCQARGVIGINQPVNDTGEQGLARMRYEGGLSIPLERLIWAAVRSQTSVLILEKAKARQGSRRAKETPRMAKTMN
jgi:hypothetical protein